MDRSPGFGYRRDFRRLSRTVKGGEPDCREVARATHIPGGR